MGYNGFIMKELEKKGRIFCIGIGGIGLSALARYFAYNGYEVSGSDSVDSELVEALRKEGIEVFIGHTGNHISTRFDLIIYSLAVSIDNIDYVTAERTKVTMLSYPEALGMVTRSKKTIAISGTHGKTTTTAMTYFALKNAGLKPTVIVGSLIGGVGSNFVPGDDEYFIVEACEYRRSFLNLDPDYIIITNIDNDHLDYYKDREDIISAFQLFSEKVKPGGAIIMHDTEWDLVRSDKKVRADYVPRGEIELSVFGEHNRSNAQLVIALAEELRLSPLLIREGLLSFPGTWRRLEYKGEGDHIWYDDYGHHPTEIRATLQALREKFPKKDQKIVVIFQPHLYSRTKLLLEDFSESFHDADEVLLLPIYASREELDETISSKMLADKIGEKAKYFEKKEEALEYAHDLPKGALILTLGAGDVYTIHELRVK